MRRYPHLITAVSGYVRLCFRSGSQCALWGIAMNNNEPFVNYELIKRIRRVREIDFDRDIAADSEQEERHLSELSRVIENFTDPEKAVCLVTILEDDPLLFYQVAVEDREYLKRKGKENGRKNTD